MRHMVGKLYLLRLGPNFATAFPWSTLTCNVLGSFAMGVLAGFLARHGQGGDHWRLLIGVGLLGGFTTFSSFSLEMMLLIERGQSPLAVTYAAVSLLAGVTGLYLGLIAMRIAGCAGTITRPLSGSSPLHRMMMASGLTAGSSATCRRSASPWSRDGHALASCALMANVPGPKTGWPPGKRCVCRRAGWRRRAPPSRAAN